MASTCLLFFGVLYVFLFSWLPFITSSWLVTDEEPLCGNHFKSHSVETLFLNPLLTYLLTYLLTDIDINLKWFRGISKPKKPTIIVGNRTCLIGTCYQLS